ncbi:helix-turn-helix transcriptional regulator [Pelotomaculum isophthalicicum JI]|uniref:Helix-turn-helix transcriptional regulator n=1 Tax=Pelotomaculum isophthalicicum JI TaxID=947010 RepID=A0A9X4H6V9_9FIRM|nr:helix-turn-helix transcriptional regulator [Pelotomaculum isophthalicicum JI]
MTLASISERFCLSGYRFNRLFRVVVGKSLKQYILGRKLTRALDRLTMTGDSIIDIAYDFGFKYPEVFSRAFKKQFGVSPATYRVEKNKVDVVEKAVIIDRNIANYQGILALKGTSVYIEELYLEGLYVDVDINAEDFEMLMKSTGESFLSKSQNIEHLGHDKLYSVVNCHGDDSGIYTVFFGKKAIRDTGKNRFDVRRVPGGWYAYFVYHGDMFDIRSIFVDDLFRWLKVREMELCSNGVGMLSIYGKDYLQSQDVRILVPINRPNDSNKCHEARR